MLPQGSKCFKCVLPVRIPQIGSIAFGVWNVLLKKNLLLGGGALFWVIFTPKLREDQFLHYIVLHKIRSKHLPYKDPDLFLIWGLRSLPTNKSWHAMSSLPDYTLACMFQCAFLYIFNLFQQV